MAISNTPILNVNGASAPPSLPALEAVNLSAGYPGDRRALDGAHFSIEPGEQVAVVGPNGAGKSTLFKAIVGLIPHTEGHISIHGADCRASHNMVGYVPQTGDIDWSFPATVSDVVMMGRTRKIGWFRWPRQRDHQIVADLLERFNLAPLAKRQIGQLSGGQKRRVFIARALAQETDVLLMDEPFTGVDATAEQDILDALATLREQDITLLLATHDLGKASRYFDRMMLIRKKVLAFGKPQDVLTPEHLRAAYGNAIGIYQQGDGQTVIVADTHG